MAQYVAEHYRQNVEPLGYKAFLVAVDREACVLYKEALDKVSPALVLGIVFTGNNNDLRKAEEVAHRREAGNRIRKAFPEARGGPKIFIVTEKLLTGFDAPILYALYLDKPMRDHTLLQAIARVDPSLRE